MNEGYVALREGAAWLDLSARARMTARGRDRARFLHNLTTQDVKNMKPGEWRYAFALTAQGRIVGDLYLACREEEFFIDTEPELREKLRTHFLKYKVADQVELEDVTEGTVSIGVEGPQAGTPIEGVETLPVTVTGQPGYRIYAPAERKAEIVARLEAAGVKAATAEDARIVRIESGRPRYGEEIVETSLPQETDQMRGVAFNKGCYLGQEIVERIRARGHVNRLLRRVELEGVVEPGSKVQVEGKEATVMSSVWSPGLGRVVGLAYVRV
jgi:folate-binding protein YgfZ